MPIKRWHGWGAQCRACGAWVELNDGVIAWAEREQVKISLDVTNGERRSLEEIITEACGCVARRRVAHALP